MGIFSRKPQEPAAGQPSVAGQLAFADQLKAQALQLQAQAMEQAAVFPGPVGRTRFRPLAQWPGPGRSWLSWPRLARDSSSAAPA